MRILIVTQIFLPEMGALSNRLYPLVRALVAAGHEVTVATGMPNYPSGKVFPRYRRALFRRESVDGYTILRTSYLTAARNKSKMSQMASYLSFVPAAFASGLRAGKIDVIFVTAPPPFPIAAAIQLANLNGAKLVFDIRDLWSDELVTYGRMQQESIAVRSVRALERWGYRRADLVTCTTQSLIDTVVARGAERAKTFFLPNGADLDLFRPLPAANAFADSYPFGNRFVVMYAGLFGIKHNLEVLLSAAEMLRDKKEIVFFLLGNGARREALIQQVKDKNLENVIIGDERKVEEVPWVIARANVCFAATQSEDYAKKLISVKIFEYMGCEKPVIGAADGESARIIEESGGGIVVSPGDERAVADSVLKFYNDSSLGREMGKLGRAYVEKYYSRGEWAVRFEKQLTSICHIPAPQKTEYALRSDAQMASPGYKSSSDAKI